MALGGVLFHSCFNQFFDEINAIYSSTFIGGFIFGTPFETGKIGQKKYIA
jgi:hypothetical protein